MEDSTPSLSWGHIVLNVRKLETSVAFYEKLGFEIFVPIIPYKGLTMEDDAAETPPEGESEVIADGYAGGKPCVMGLKGAFPMIDLTEADGREPIPPLLSRDLDPVRICLASHDLKADYAQLESVGVPFLTPPCISEDETAMIAICTDPDGTLIELIQLHLEKKRVH